MAAQRRIYVDVIETSEDIEILADIPGLHKDDIIVDIDSNTVTLDAASPMASRPPHGCLSAEPRLKRASATHLLAEAGPGISLAHPADDAIKAAPTHLPQTGSVHKLHYNERCSRFTRRSLVLPESADLKRASAVYRDGVLQIVVPKLQTAPTKRLRVR